MHTMFRFNHVERHSQRILRALLQLVRSTVHAGELEDYNPVRCFLVDLLDSRELTKRLILFEEITVDRIYFDGGYADFSGKRLPRATDERDLLHVTDALFLREFTNERNVGAMCSKRVFLRLLSEALKIETEAVLRLLLLLLSKELKIEFRDTVLLVSKTLERKAKLRCLDSRTNGRHDDLTARCHEGSEIYKTGFCRSANAACLCRPLTAGHETAESRIRLCLTDQTVHKTNNVRLVRLAHLRLGLRGRANGCTTDVPLITSSAFFGRLTTEVFAEEGYTSLFLSLVSRGLFSSGYICGETAVGDPTTVFRPSLIGLGMTTACTAAIRNVAAGKTTAEEEDYIVNVLFHDFSPFSGLYQKKQVSPILLWNSPMEPVHHPPQTMTTADIKAYVFTLPSASHTGLGPSSAALQGKATLERAAYQS